ncbi:MAG: AsmA family protein [Alphaproteobacteria bacterium]|nr:AsmA family protein [Alphaproteobacteria bacterium]
MTDSQPPRRSLRLLRRLRIALLLPVLMLGVPVGAAAVLLASFDASHYKPEIVAALQRATGREVRLDGPVRLALNPRLALEATDVALGNVPGGTRPDMAKVDRVEAELPLLPLLRGHVQVTRLVLIHPDVLLETDAEGHPNWRFHREAVSAPAAVPSIAGEIARRAHGGRFNIQQVRVEDGRLTWHDGRSGETRVVDVPRLELSEPAETAPVAFTGELRYTGRTIALTGELGPLARLRDAASRTPWPVKVSVADSGLRITAAGTLTDPRHSRGYDAIIEATADDLGRLSGLLPGWTPPPLREVSLKLALHDLGLPWPAPSAVVLHVGDTDLGQLVPGLHLGALDISAPQADQPVHVTASGTYAATPLKLAVDLGAPLALLSPTASGSLPVTIDAEAAGASLAVNGGVAATDPSGATSLKIAAKIPDLALLGPLVHRTLPALKDVALDAEVANRGAHLLDGVVIKGIKLAMPQADLTGSAVIGLGGTRPVLFAVLSAKHVDLDALAGAEPGPAPAAAAPAPAPAGAGGAAPPAPAAPAPTGHTTVLSDRQLPIDRLRQADAEMKITVGQLVAGGAEMRNVIAHFRLTNGHLHVAPLEGLGPAGAFDVVFDFNPNQPNTPVSFAAHAPGIPLKPLLAAFGLPGDASGALELDADLKSAGDTPHAIAAGVNGHLGIALVDGAVDNRVLAAAVEPLLRNAKLPDAVVGNGGRSDVRCLALRADATRGAVALRALMLDMAHFRLAGGGNLNLADETLALRLRPLLKLGGSGVTVPVQLDGPWLAPRTSMQPDTAAAAVAPAILPNKLARRLGPLAALAGPSESQRLRAAADSGDCGAALALARDGRPGAVPGPPSSEQSAPDSHADLTR